MTLRYIPVPAANPEHEIHKHYALWLETLGFDEMRIRKAMSEHFPLCDPRENGIFDSSNDARIRYVTMIHKISPAKTHKGLVIKLSASLGISEHDAEAAICRYEETGELSYVPWFPVRDT